LSRTSHSTTPIGTAPLSCLPAPLTLHHTLLLAPCFGSAAIAGLIDRGLATSTTSALWLVARTVELMRLRNLCETAAIFPSLAVTDLERPLPPDQRSPFLAAVFEEASRHTEIGPGLITRIARALQRRYMRGARGRTRGLR
jgi:hypothetical protein